MALFAKFYRPENCPNVVAPDLNTKIWNGNLLLSHRLADINLRKIELLNL